MAKFLARCRNNENKFFISIRVYKRNVVNNAIPLDISLSEKDWYHIDMLLRDAEEAESKGGGVVFRQHGRLGRCPHEQRLHPGHDRSGGRRLPL